MITVWETICSKPENIGITGDAEGLLNAYPIKNIYDPHGGYGVVAAEFTPDNKYLVTLGNGIYTIGHLCKGANLMMLKTFRRT